MTVAPSRLVAFALAGMTLFGFVLDEYDVPHDNVQGLVVLASGAFVGLIAGVLVASRPSLRDHATGLAWDAVRLVLGYEMIRYGIAKLTGMQFYPLYWRVDQRTDDLSPSSLAWAFLGRSYWYQAFGGAIEAASGVLVCFRRTTLLGACLMATALLNAVLINYFYDVPVKLVVSVYLLFDVALIARDWRRLRDVFLAPVERPQRGAWSRSLQGLAVALAIVVPTVKMLREGAEHRVFEQEPLEGAWTIDERTGAADATWERLYFEKDDRGSIRAGSTRLPFMKQLAGTQLQLAVSEPDRRYDLRVSFAIEGQTLRIDGTCDGQPCAMKLTKVFPR